MSDSITVDELLSILQVYRDEGCGDTKMYIKHGAGYIPINNIFTKNTKTLDCGITTADENGERSLILSHD